MTTNIYTTLLSSTPRAFLRIKHLVPLLMTPATSYIALSGGRRSASDSASAAGGDAEPLDIQEYMWSGDAEEKPLQIKQPPGPAAKSRHPSKQDVFESIIDPACFLSLVLAKPITQSLARISLSWHRFFLPQTPTLVSVRRRLLSNDSASHSPATKLLFALLCLVALETPECASEQYAQQIPGVQLAVLSYGQDFIFSPPLHRDSIVVCLLLSDYRPTAIVSSQSVAHKTVKPDLYVNITYRIAERLELLSEKPRLDINMVGTMSSIELEAELIESLQTLQLYSYDALTS